MNTMNIPIIQALCVVGFFLSLYAFSVKQRMSHGMGKRLRKKFLCDVSSNISCSKAFGSTYGSLLGFSNTIVGLVFYPAVFALASLGAETAVQMLVMLSGIGTVYLAYLSYVKQRNFCLVCTAIYTVNALLLVVGLVYIYMSEAL